ncbi:hypothetical protein DSECCO2_81000 [anaerobic digester metagenome]
MRIFYLAALILLVVLLGAGSALGANAQIVFYLFIFIMGVGIAFYAHWFKKFAEKVNALMPLIESDPDAYIAETEKLLQGKNPSNIRAMLIMNISVAYIEKGDFKTALQKMKSINGGALKKANNSIYFLNYAYILIHLEEHAQAMDIIKKYKKKFLSLPMGGNLPRLIAFVQIFELMQEEKWDIAIEQLKIARENWPDRVTGVDFSFLEEKLEQHNAQAIIEE